MAHRVPLGLILLSLAVVPANSQSVARTFCLEASPEQDPLAYKRRLNGYCDGRVFYPQSGDGDLIVLGVAAGGSKQAPATPLRLTTVVPDESGPEILAPLHLQGLSKVSGVNYRLDAPLSKPGAVLEIGPEAVLYKLTPPLKFQDVGWSAYSDSPKSGRVYVPVTTQGSVDSGVEVLVRPTISTAYITYSVRSTSGGVLIEEAELPGVAPGTAVTIVIPSSGPSAVAVEVTAVGNDGATQMARVQISRRRRR
jgi:hypothetical protein